MKAAAKYALIGLMTGPDIQLPDDVETLKAMVAAMSGKMAERAARVEALEGEVADLKARNAAADERIERLTQMITYRVFRTFRFDGFF
jgi:transposase